MVVIGIGNSGGDIAVDVSRVAEKVSCCATFLYFYVVFKKNSDVYEYESTVFLMILVNLKPPCADMTCRCTSVPEVEHGLLAV